MKRAIFNTSLSKELSDKPIQVSLDVHTTNTYIFAANIETGEILCDKNVTGNYKNAVKHIEKLGPLSSICVVYEAGCLGTAPYRHFTKLGITCKIIAPVSIPQVAKNQKCDKIDASSNFRYHIGGNLRYVTVPDYDDECAQMCLRMRYEKVSELTKCKQRIHGIVFRIEEEFTGTKTYWTKAHFDWLKTVNVQAFIRITLNGYLDRISSLGKELAEIDKNLLEYINSKPAHAKFYKALTLLPGIGFVNAVTTILEGQDLSRFKHPTALMSYVGVIPGKHASGTSDPSCRITKSGNMYLRLAMVGIAKQFRDRRLLLKEKDLKNLPSGLSAFITRMQTRLFYKYSSMVDKKKPAMKARVAVARELCAFLWEYATKVLPEFELAA